MRRLILQTSVSIDGYVAALDGSHPWGEGSEDEVFKRWILDSVGAAGAHLMGRVTYEEMAAFWPTSTSEYAQPMNEIPKVVVSRTLERADWPETRIARGDLSEEIGSLKREAGNDLIAYGGATLDQGLSRLGLVDEYRLMVQPAALRAGLPLFKDLSAPLHLELRRSDHLRDGRRHSRLPAALKSRRPAARSGLTRVEGQDASRR